MPKIVLKYTVTFPLNVFIVHFNYWNEFLCLQSVPLIYMQSKFDQFILFISYNIWRIYSVNNFPADEILKWQRRFTIYYQISLRFHKFYSMYLYFKEDYMRLSGARIE